jgi:hypothetical protein
MKAIVVLVCVAAAGCMTPCRATAKHAVAMARSCVETKDAKLALVCGVAYESVRNELADGACSVEVSK